MFGMGVALHFSDFVSIWQQRYLVVIGVLLQYVCMPLLAIIISYSFHLSRELTIGMIVVGSCPGGTASNVMAYLARANLALSVTLTLCSTLLAPLITPSIIYLVLSQKVEVPFFAMAESILRIVFCPLVAGLLVRHLFGRTSNTLLSYSPSVSIFSISAIIACVIALNRDLLLTFPLLIFFAVLLHNVFGLGVGYLVGKLLRSTPANRRTLALEVGMQNSGLGVSLANQFFSPVSALPGAIFSLLHNLTGTILAKWWSLRNSEK